MAPGADEHGTLINLNSRSPCDWADKFSCTFYFPMENLAGRVARQIPWVFCFFTYPIAFIFNSVCFAFLSVDREFCEVLKTASSVLESWRFGLVNLLTLVLPSTAYWNAMHMMIVNHCDMFYIPVRLLLVRFQLMPVLCRLLLVLLLVFEYVTLGWDFAYSNVVHWFVRYVCNFLTVNVYITPTFVREYIAGVADVRQGVGRYAAYVAPFLEEVIKRTCPPQGLLLVGTELWARRHMGRVPYLAFGLHIACYFMPFHWAVIAHSGWNLYAFSKDFDAPLPPQLPPAIMTFALADATLLHTMIMDFLVSGGVLSVPKVSNLVRDPVVGAWFCRFLICTRGIYLAHGIEEMGLHVGQLVLGSETVASVVGSKWADLSLALMGTTWAEGSFSRNFGEWVRRSEALWANLRGSKIWRKLVSLISYGAVGSMLAGVARTTLTPHLSARLDAIQAAVGDWGTLAMGILSIVSEIARGGWAYLNGQHYDWFKGDKLVELPLRAEELLSQKAERCTSSVHSDGRVSAEIYLAELDETSRQIELFLRDEPRHPMASRFQALFRQLAETAAETKSALATSTWRMAPCVFGLQGNTGIGKTGFAQAIFSVVGDTLGLGPLDKNQPHNVMKHVYTVGQEKHDDAFNGQEFCFIDDIGVTGDDQVLLDSVRKLMSIANNAPYRANMADLAQKGKLTMLYSLVVVTSNRPDYGAGRALYMPDALLRRLQAQVSLEPKPEYSTSGPGGKLLLDPLLVPEGEMSLWVITVQVPRTCVHHPYIEFVDVLKTDNVATALAKLREIFIAHRAGQKRLIERLSAPPGELCTRGVRVTMHGSRGSEPCGTGCNVGSTPEVALMPLVRETVHVRGMWRGALVWAAIALLCSYSWWAIPFVVFVCFILDGRVRWRLGMLALLYKRGHVERDSIPGLLLLLWSPWNEFYRALYEAQGESFRRGARGLAVGCVFATLLLLVSCYRGHKALASADGNAVESGVREDDELDYKPSSWTRPPPKVFDRALAAIPPVGVDQAIPALAKRLYVVTVRSAQRTQVSHWFQIGGDCFLALGHCVPDSRFEAKVSNSPRGASVFTQCATYDVLPASVHRFGPDLALVRLVGAVVARDCYGLMFPCLADVPEMGVVHRLSRDLETSALIRHGPGVQHRVRVAYIGLGVPHFDGRAVCMSGGSGVCGSVYYTVTGRNLRITGFHCSSGGAESQYIPMGAYELQEAYRLLATASPLPMTPTMPEGGEGWQEFETQPHYKSNLHLLSVQIQGDFVGRDVPHIIYGDSRVTHTTNYRLFQSLVEQTGSHYGPPVMRGKLLADGTYCDPVQNFLRCFNNTKPVDVLDAVDRASSIIRLAGKWGRKRCAPLSDHDMLNGRHIRNLDSVDWSTSCGYPHYGSKRPHIEVKTSADGKSTYVVMGPELEIDFQRAHETARSGKRGFFVFAAVFKDEAVSVSKIEAGDTRVIAACPLVLTLLGRKYILPLLVDLLNGIPEIAIGIDAYGEEGGSLVESLFKAPGEGDLCFYDGDLVKFDRCFSPWVMWMLMSLVEQLARLKGYSPEDTLAAVTIFFEIVQPIVSVGGELYTFTNFQTSGNPFTAMLNSLLVLSFFLAAAARRQIELRLLLTLYIYGDDNVFATRTDFSFDEVAREAEAAGFHMTPGNKGVAAGTSYEDVTFLKRHFRWHTDLNRYVMALSKKSIAKTLTWMVPSKVVSRQEQEGWMISNCLRESVLWGRDFHSELMAMLRGCDPDIKVPMANKSYDEWLVELSAPSTRTWWGSSPLEDAELVCTQADSHSMQCVSNSSSLDKIQSHTRVEGDTYDSLCCPMVRLHPSWCTPI